MIIIYNIATMHKAWVSDHETNRCATSFSHHLPTFKKTPLTETNMALIGDHSSFVHI